MHRPESRLRTCSSPVRWWPNSCYVSMEAATRVNDSRKFPWLGGLVAAVLLAVVLIVAVIQGHVAGGQRFRHPGHRHQLPALTRCSSIT